jgi:sulfite reductase (ferredoxin)
LADVSACPGPRVCNLGLADPRVLGAELSARLSAVPEAREAGLSLRISGCSNSCCHHKAAPLGLEGGQRQYQGRWYPAFRLYAGGGGAAQEAIGRPVAVLPAARVGEALQALLGVFRRERRAEEGLLAWLRRREDSLESFMAPYALPDLAQAGHFKELGTRDDFVPYARGQAQC